MEKGSPHYKIARVRLMIQTGEVRVTSAARLGATAMGLGLDDMLGIVLSLKAADFYKSMTSHADHRIWQDVYRPNTPAGAIYLKLSVVKELLIVSFKEL